MTGRSHMKVALCSTILTGNPFLIASSIVGSLLPDIDTKTSLIATLFPFHGWPLCKLRHRGFTHSLICLFIVTGLFHWFLGNYDITMGIAIGYLSHILADMMTVSGVQLIWPQRHKYKFGTNIRTGSFWEHCIVNFALIGIAYIILERWSLI